MDKNTFFRGCEEEINRRKVTALSNEKDFKKEIRRQKGILPRIFDFQILIVEPDKFY